MLCGAASWTRVRQKPWAEKLLSKAGIKRRGQYDEAPVPCRKNTIATNRREREAVKVFESCSIFKQKIFRLAVAPIQLHVLELIMQMNEPHFYSPAKEMYQQGLTRALSLKRKIIYTHGTILRMKTPASIYENHFYSEKIFSTPLSKTHSVLQDPAAWPLQCCNQTVSQDIKNAKIFYLFWRNIILCIWPADPLDSVQWKFILY